MPLEQKPPGSEDESNGVPSEGHFRLKEPQVQRSWGGASRWRQGVGAGAGGPGAGSVMGKRAGEGTGWGRAYDAPLDRAGVCGPSSRGALRPPEGFDQRKCVLTSSGGKGRSGEASPEAPGLHAPGEGGWRCGPGWAGPEGQGRGHQRFGPEQLDGGSRSLPKTRAGREEQGGAPSELLREETREGAVGPASPTLGGEARAGGAGALGVLRGHRGEQRPSEGTALGLSSV